MDEKENQVRVVDLQNGFYLVETPTKFVIYEDLFDVDHKTKRWRVYKGEVTTITEAVKGWLTSLN